MKSNIKIYFRKPTLQNKIDYFEERAKRKQAKEKVLKMQLKKSKEMKETKDKIRVAEENLNVFKSFVM
jgi:hypothetical protein